MILARKTGVYEKYVKRFLDIVCSLLFIFVFFWLFIIVAIMVRIKLGTPVLFHQPRPGIIKDGKETIFYMSKFRTMTDECDNCGNLLPDSQRLGKFGEKLRRTSLDELPEVFAILKGEMSIVGPRPQLVRDMVFMDEQQRMRHTAKPGLTGLAQVKGRNAISWEEKLDWDLKYIDHVCFFDDLRIIIETIKVALIRKEGITDGENCTALDYGDYLLKAGKVSKSEYERLQEYAQKLIEESEKR